MTHLICQSLDRLSSENQCSKDADYLRCKAELNLKFTNTGSTSLVILQPQGEYEFWHGGTSLALSEKESGTNSFVYDVSGWPSVYKSPMYQSLANLLDHSVPPTGITRVLLPSASWNWDTSITFTLREGNSCNQHVGSRSVGRRLSGGPLLCGYECLTRCGRSTSRTSNRTWEAFCRKDGATDCCTWKKKLENTGMLYSHPSRLNFL